MAHPEVIAERQETTLKRVRDILIKHHPEAQVRLQVYHPTGGVPNSYTLPDQYGLFVAESVQILAELLDPILEERKPKKRGRPPTRKGGEGD